MKKFFSATLVLCVVLLSFSVRALPTGWNYAQTVTVQNNAATQAISYQLQLTINTQALIAAGQLNPSGSDLRFGKDCDGLTLFNYWIESGLNTANTIVWVKIDTLNPLASHTFYMFYGNPVATPVSNVNGTFFGPHSATDSVASGSAGGVGNSQRGFRFAPTQDILVTSFGKREPTGTTRYVTLFNFATQAIVAQMQVGGPAAQYAYGNLPNPIWLTQGTQYSLQLFQAAGDGYYFGSSSQIGQHLTYYDMKYCNSCTQNTFPTSTLTNYHYGYPDLWYYTKNTLTPLPSVTFAPVPGPSVSATVAPSATVCQGDTVTLTATGSGTMSWSGGVSNGVPFQAMSSGTYTVTASNVCGGVATATVALTVNSTAAPAPVSASPSSLCAGSSTDLNAVSAGNTIQWYTVPTGGTSIGNSASAANFSVTPGTTTTYYAAAVSAAGGSQTFSYTGAPQLFIVPPGVTSLDIECWGAQGGANWVNNNNFGGYGKGTFAVTPGDTLYVYVGGQPNSTAGGYNGGGAGDGAGRGGGGASDVRSSGNTLNDRLLVAGGGGGAGYWSSLHVVGGVGGGPGQNGGDGYREPSYAANPGGLGATPLAAGANGTCINFNVTTMAGGFGFGGTPLGFGCGCEGYGGGGGYYGGAGSGNCRGAGGGSGYLSPMATNPVATAGIRAGNGQAVITWNGTGCISYTRTPVTVTVNPLPTVTASPASQTLCQGAQTSLIGGGASTYVWSGGISDNTPFTVTSPGTYTVTGTDLNNCTNTATAVINVNTVPTVTAASSQPAICLGGSVIFTGGGASSYAWTDGMNTPVDALPYTPGTAGSSTYTVTGTDANGCTATSTLNFTVHSLPAVSATASPNDTVCGNAPLTLSGNGASSYAWSGGVTDNVPFLLGAPGTFTVTGTDANGCTGTSSIEIFAYPAPLPLTLSSLPLVPDVCGTNPVILTASGAVSYSWTGGISNGVAFYPPATNVYTVTGTDPNGCTVTATVTVNVNTASGNLALVAGANALSISGSSTTNFIHPPGTHVKYYNAACNLVCEIETDALTNLDQVVAQVVVSAAVQTYNGQPYLRRRFVVTPAINGPAINVILPVLQADFNSYNLASPLWPQLPTGPADVAGIANIRITKIDGGTLGVGTPVVITPTVNWNGSYWELSFPVTGFSEFYIHGVNPGNVPLPVMLESFTGVRREDGHALQWMTASETGNDYFTLQHSTDGSLFSDLTKVNSRAPGGNSQTPLTYQYVHDNPRPGHNYYRLLQTDIDGRSTQHAGVVDLMWGSTGSTLALYPNPARDVLHADLFLPKAAKVELGLYDMSGRLVKMVQVMGEPGLNSLNVTLDALAAGVYSVQVNENGQRTHVGKVQVSK